jgi:hypothetical protein
VKSINAAETDLAAGMKCKLGALCFYSDLVIVYSFVLPKITNTATGKTLPPMLKSEITQKTLSKTRLDMNTLSTKRTYKKADRIQQMVQMTEKKEKAQPSHFFEFLNDSRKNYALSYTWTDEPDVSLKRNCRFLPKHLVTPS